LSTLRPLKPIWLAAILLVTLAAALVALAAKITQTPAAAQVLPRVSQELPPVVKTLAVELQDHALQLETNGIVSSMQQVQLIAQLDGDITAMNSALNEATIVEANTPIIQIHSQPVQAQALAAAARVADAQGQLAQIKAQLDIAGEVEGLQTPTQLRQQRLAAAQTSLEAAQAEADLVQTQVDGANVTLPFDAIVQVEELSIGQQVRQGVTLGRAFDPSKLAVDFKLTAHQARFVDQALAQHGFAKVVLAESFGDEYRYHASQLTATTRQVDPQTGLESFRLPIEAPMGQLLPGERLEVRLEIPSEQAVLRLPLEALTLDQQVMTVNALSTQTQNTVSAIQGQSMRQSLPEGTVKTLPWHLLYQDQRYAYGVPLKTTQQQRWQVILTPPKWLTDGKHVRMAEEEYLSDASS